MNEIIENIYQKAKSKPQKIVLVEPEDERVKKAHQIALQKKIAQTILIDKKTNKYSFFDQLVENFYQLRKEKGITLDQAKETLTNPLYFGAMMVKSGFADGMVAGANHTTQDTFRPALQIIKAKSDQKIISSFFILETKDNSFGEKGVFIFADCGLNINPNSDQLAEIAIQSAKSFKQLIGVDPKIAMLSYSTNGSSSGETVDKVKLATDIVKKTNPKLNIEGETQADAAIVPQISFQKSPKSQLKGQANILVFPDLNSGNIAYKLVERLAHAHAYGPLMQGINQPINDLSRGCSVDDIVTTIAITSVQSISSW